MMKNLKRTIALLLVVAMMLSLGACGKKDKDQDTVTLLQDEVGYGYLTSYQELDLPVDYVNSVTAVDGKVYFAGDYYDEETMMGHSMVIAVDPATGATTEYPVPALEDNQYTQSFSVSNQGDGYWMVIVTMEDMYNEPPLDPGFAVDPMIPEEEMPEEEIEEESSEEAPAEEGGFVMTPALGARDVEATMLSNEPMTLDEPAEEVVEEEITEEAVTEEAVTEEVTEDMIIPEPEIEGEYYAPSEEYDLVKFDLSGNLVTTIDLSPVMEEQEYFYAQQLVEMSNGELLVVSDMNLYVFGTDGTLAQNLPVNGYVNSAVALSDGGVLITYYDYENMVEAMMVLKNGTMTPLQSDFNANNGVRFFPGDDKSVFVTDYEILYKMDITTGATEKVLSWLDSDIVGYSVDGVFALSEDKLVATSNRYDEVAGHQVFEIITLTKTPASEMPERAVLSYGCLWPDSRIQQQIINFNRKSQTHRIAIIDYSKFNTEDNYELGLEQMEKDMVTGACPDIVDISNLTNVDKYISKGVFTDLVKLMTEDGEYTMDSFLTGPLSGYLEDGKLYAMPLSCSMQILYGSARLMQGKDSISMEELADFAKNMEEGVGIMQYMTSAGMLELLYNWNQSRFVDYSKASCTFDSPEFIAMMELCRYLPESIDWSDDSMVYMDEMQMLQEGSILLSLGYMSDPWSAKMVMNLYNEENGIMHLTLPGTEYPALLRSYNGMAVSAASPHQDAAWDFIKSMLTDEAQGSFYEIPVTVTAFDQLMQEAMEKSYYMEDGEKVYYDDTMWIGEVEYDLAPLTQEQADEFKDMVNSAMFTGSYDSNIWEIISEESGAFFAGDKSAEETATLIQNRVKIYLGETS